MTLRLPFYRDPSIKEPDFFDEGPHVILTKTKSILSSSIDTSAIDGYRQGVEITHQKFFDMGTVKISAGEPGHVLRRNRFGEDKVWDTQTAYQDKDYFNPVKFVSASAQPEDVGQSANFTFPILTSDSTQIDNYNFDGIIEPLSIRPVASFFSIDIPFESHGVRGSLMGGNLDSLQSSERVVTVDYVNQHYLTGSNHVDRFPTQQIVPFLDMMSMFNDGTLLSGSLAGVGIFINDLSPRDPFVDARYVGNVVHSASMKWPTDMLDPLSLMTGSTDNYVPWNKRSATCGFTFDGVTGVGTDSIVFGGRVH